MDRRPPPTPPSDDEIRILCVDDEHSVLKALQRLFLDEDWEILAAGSAEEGLDILRQGKPVQIVISDYRMPGMTGVDFFREVYKAWPDTVRLVLSGYADTAAIVEAINEGHIYKFIAKPWNDDELRVTLHNALETFFLKNRNRELSTELEQRATEMERLNAELSALAAERTEDLLTQTATLMAREAEKLQRSDLAEMALTAFEMLPVGLLVVADDGTVRLCNRWARDLTGTAGTLTPEKHRRDVLPDTVNRLIEKALAEGRSEERVALASGDVTVAGIRTRPPAPLGVVVTLRHGASA